MKRTLSFLTAVRGFDANGRRRGVRLFPGDELLLALEPRNRYGRPSILAAVVGIDINRGGEDRETEAPLQKLRQARGTHQPVVVPRE